MRKVYLDDLPHQGKLIDWKNSIGYQIPFIYDDIKSNLDIINYNPKNNKITIQYQDNKINISICHLKEVKIGVVLKKCNHVYKYHIDEIVQIKNSTIKILMQIKMKHGHQIEKGYKYQCLKDGYIGKISECNLINGCGCPICTNQKIMIGVNDMWTTNPEQAKLLANPEDGYKYMQQSNKKVDWKCPECDNIIKNKDISKIYYYGLSCPRCSDGISYPEKFMYNILKQLNIDFEYQYRPKWCRYKFKDRIKQGRYDFYIPEKQIIIEMDGGLGHGHKNNLSKLSAKESKEIDNLKDKLANQQGINVIRIDCNYNMIDNKFNYLKNNILNSKLIHIFNILNINWIEIDKQSQSSLIKQICNTKKLYPDMNITQIGKIFKLHKRTIARYLKQGNKYGWCQYNITKSKKVICIETQKTYLSTYQAASATSIWQASICNCCNGRLNSAGKSPDGTKLHWQYYDEYLKNKNGDDKN